MSSRIHRVDEVVVAATIAFPDDTPNFVVAARGQAATPGWSNEHLSRHVYLTQPADGIQDYDFVADPPTGPTPDVLTAITVIELKSLPNWVKGVRIHSATNDKEYLIP